MSTPGSQKVDVWIVEDNEQYRATIARLINQTTSLICNEVFGSCEALLRRLSRELSPEVLLMDIGLPGMSGIEGVRKVKEISPHTDVVMLTAFDDDDKIFQAICAGATGYLVKSSTEEEIVGSLQLVLDGGAPITPQIARRVLQIFSRMSVARHEYRLSDREREILRLMVDGNTKKQIADRLFLSYHTIDSHAKNIYVKLQVNTCNGAVGKALKEHLV